MKTLLLLFVVAAVALCGCGGSSKSSTTSVVSTTLVPVTSVASSTTAASTTAAPTVVPTTAVAPTTTVVPTTVAPTTTVAATTTTAATRPGFDQALAEWKSGAAAISASQAGFWYNAGQDLYSGQKTDPNPTGYANAEVLLNQLSQLPDADMTAAQQATYTQDISALDSFFDTPGLYS